MPLSDDQRAMLRLLAQREEGYEDIAALLGLSAADVRARVREALAELDAESSRGAAPRASRLPDATEETAPAEEEREKAKAPASRGAEPAGTAVPEDREQPSRAPEPAARRGSPRAAPRPSRRPRLPANRRRLAELVGGGLVLALLVLFVTGAVSIGGDSDSDGNGDAANGTAVAAEEDKLTQAALRPVGDSEARGQAVFGRVGEDPVLQVQAEGLDPSPKGDSYTVWLYRAPKLALRVGAVKVGEGEGLAARLPIPLELLGFVANGAFKQIRVSLTDDSAYEDEIAQAKRQNRLPRYTGETVLRGPIVGPAVETGSGEGGG